MMHLYAVVRTNEGHVLFCSRRRVPYDVLREIPVHRVASISYRRRKKVRRLRRDLLFDTSNVLLSIGPTSSAVDRRYQTESLGIENRRVVFFALSSESTLACASLFLSVSCVGRPRTILSTGFDTSLFVVRVDFRVVSILTTTFSTVETPLSVPSCPNRGTYRDSE